MAGLLTAGVRDVAAVELPLTGLDDDVAAARAAVGSVAGASGEAVVLVGHSYGGIVVTNAGGAPDVAHLVFVAALVPDLGESGLSVGAGSPSTVLGESIVSGDDGAWITVRPDRATAAFYADCEKGVAEAAVARLRPQPTSSLVAETTVAAWRRTPSTYILCEHDEAVHPVLQERMATRAGGEVVRLASGHSPFLSQPETVVEIITALCAAPRA